MTSTLPRSPGRPRSFDRDAALEAATRLLWRQGYEATSVRELTDELRITPPSLYAAFGSKQELFREALAHYEAGHGAFVEAAITSAPSALAAAELLLGQGPAMYTRDGLPRGCLVETGDAGTSDEQIHGIAEATRKRKAKLLADRIRDDQRRGLLDAAVDADALADFTLGTLRVLAGLAREGHPEAHLASVARIALGAWPRERGDDAGSTAS